MPNHMRVDVPYVFQGTAAPRCHVACFRMILASYGLKYTTPYLMNLSGYNYGFTYFKEAKMAFAGPATPLGPWQILSYAANKIGCETEFIKDKPWDETWELMQEYLGQDKPLYVARLDMQYLWKTPQPVPHVVVLCGYDEDRGVVIIHDPALGEAGEGIQYLPPNKMLERMSGCFAEFEIEDFRKACALEEIQWAFSGKNGFCVITPPAEQPNISWPEVIERNGRIILGNIEEATQLVGSKPKYGPDALKEFAHDLASGFGMLEEPPIFAATLRGLRGLTFRSGSSYMFDASAFTAGLSTLTADPNLAEASHHLGSIGLCYDESLGEIEHIMDSHSMSKRSLRKSLTRISLLLERAADHARMAGSYLVKGAEAVT